MLGATSSSMANALYRLPYSRFGYADMRMWSCDGSLMIWCGELGTSLRTAALSQGKTGTQLNHCFFISLNRQLTEKSLGEVFDSVGNVDA